jgi:hypothetical protein
MWEQVVASRNKFLAKDNATLDELLKPMHQFASEHIFYDNE